MPGDCMSKKKKKKAPLSKAKPKKIENNEVYFPPRVVPDASIHEFIVLSAKLFGNEVIYEHMRGKSTMWIAASLIGPQHIMFISNEGKYVFMGRKSFLRMVDMIKGYQETDELKEPDWQGKIEWKTDESWEFEGLAIKKVKKQTFEVGPDGPWPESVINEA